MPTGPYPLTDLAVVDSLGDDLRAAGYTADGVSATLGDDANEWFSPCVPSRSRAVSILAELPLMAKVLVSVGRFG